MQVEQPQQTAATPKPSASSPQTSKTATINTPAPKQTTTPSAPVKKPASELSEDEQLRIAMEMSLTAEAEERKGTQPTPAASSTVKKSDQPENMDVDSLMNNPAFI